jgi:Uncharacterized protein conserved in bacteria C-term(DUF2220)
MSSGPSAFAAALLDQGRRRMRIEEARALWRLADPIGASAEDAHSRFRQALDVLDASGLIALPTSLAAWDRSVHPALPRSLVVATVPTGGVSAPVTAWVPKLGFAASERNPATLGALRAINDWLKRGRGLARPTVPVTERSLEIFGDEKRLDALRSGDALFGGRLHLADLACARLPPFLTWHPGPPGRSVVLVVENAAAFASFRRFNEEARSWAAVVWGQGNAFRHNHAGLGDIYAATGADRALYFGDLDPKGVEILAGVMRERYGDVLPHRALYTALARQRMTRREPTATLARDRSVADLHALLPQLAELVTALWRDGMVLPQEGYGLQALIDDPAPAAGL